MGPFTAQQVPILDAALDTLEDSLGRSARLRVRHLAEDGAHAFLYATILDSDGGPVDYRDTPHAEAAAHGGKSDIFVALLARPNQDWVVLESRVGPTDMAWESWAEDHGAATGLMVIPG